MRRTQNLTNFVRLRRNCLKSCVPDVKMSMKTQEGELGMDQRRREILRHIGGRVKYQRRELGLSRDEVAKILGITPRTLAAYERGEREMSMEMAIELANDDCTAMAAIILEGLGGKENLESIDHCITRLRLEVKDRLLVDEKKIKSSGVSGVIRPGKTSVQVVVGPKVQFVFEEFKKLAE